MKAVNVERTLKLCTACGSSVTNLARHKKRVHSKKSWGYLCPCGHFENHFNQVRMRNHIKKHTDVTLESCIKHIDYVELTQCPKCDFQCLSQVELSNHDAKTHRVNEDSFSNKLEDLLNETENLLKNSNI